MANYLDGISGGKHSSDEVEVKDTLTTFTVTLTFDCVVGKTPLEAAKTVSTWLLESANEMVYDVTNEENNEAFTVDLSETDADAVLPN